MRRWLVLGALILGCGLAPAASAVVIASEPGNGNTTLPADDPGFGRVGVPQVASVVYLGNGWVMTANHVGDTNVTLGGVVYPKVPGSRVTFSNPDASVPDLSVYRIDPHPDFGILPIRATTPGVGTPVLMVGHGLDRVAPVSWNGYAGFSAYGTQSVRWGTNVVAGSGTLGGDAAFATVFDPGESEHEAQAVYGDSGGPVFTKNEQGVWELAGILFTIDVYEDQPASLVLEGNASYAIDLASYRDQIIAVVRPDCSDEIDNDGDGQVDHPGDAGCSSAEDVSEDPACDDGLDDDGDGLVDFPADPGCRNDLPGSIENPACNDGVDNDGDGNIDGADFHCAVSPAWWTQEVSAMPRGCGLGAELVLVIPPLAALRRRRARAVRDSVL